MDQSAFVNRVAESGLVTIDLSTLLVGEDEIALFDLKPFLFMELMLKEKDFRQQLKDFDWQPFTGKFVAVYCSADAIIPVWAYMLVASYLQPIAKRVVLGDAGKVREQLLLESVEGMDITELEGKRVVIKGCGDDAVSEAAYLAVTAKLLPAVQSIMYGEPCSTVPVYKRKRD